MELQEILALRTSFTGTNEAFCKHHQLSISAFYRYKSLQQAQSVESPPQFVCVEQQTQRAQVSIAEQPTINFNIRTGQRALPVTLCLMLSSRLLKVYLHEDVC